MKFYPIIQKLMFLLPPEWAHGFSLAMLDLLNRTYLLRLFFRSPENKSVEVMGIKFQNPIGLAAGLDKNGDHINSLSACGFGFIEIGTVTPLAQPGNEKPRLFRLEKDMAIINRMGFNNKGVKHLVEMVKKSKPRCKLGINIGKNKSTSNEEAIKDYLKAYDAVYNYADYIAINISSPNTPGLRDMQHGENLYTLIKNLKQKQNEYVQQGSTYVPLVVKVAPDLDREEVQMLANVFLELKVDGVIATNTTIQRDNLTETKLAQEIGGLSGRPVRFLSDTVLEQLVAMLGGEVAVIASGGVMSIEDAQRKMKLGAQLVQIYTGFIYNGPALIKGCVNNV